MLCVTLVFPSATLPLPKLLILIAFDASSFIIAHPLFPAAPPPVALTLPDPASALLTFGESGLLPSPPSPAGENVMMQF